MRLRDGHAERRDAGERRLEDRPAIEVDAEARDRHQFHRRIRIDALVVYEDVGEVTHERGVLVLLPRLDDERGAGPGTARAQRLHQFPVPLTAEDLAGPCRVAREQRAERSPRPWRGAPDSAAPRIRHGHLE